MLENCNYWISIFILMIGFYGVVVRGNLAKKIMSLAVLQTAVLLFYISVANVEGGAVPIRVEGASFYINPLPHVLMLTAIVVGVAVMSVGLAIVVRIKEEYGTIEEDDISAADRKLVKEEGKF